MIQLSLLDLSPVEEVEPQPIAPSPPPLTLSERHTLTWLHAKANYYLCLMNRYMDGKRCRQEVRQDEMLRVYELREVVLAEIEKLEKRNLST